MPEIPENFDEAADSGLRLTTYSPSSEVDSDSIVASCDCLTKTNDVKYHKAGCKYRLICERDAAREEVARWKKNIIPFLAVHAGTYGRDHYGEGCMHYTHYDMLAEAGGRMDDFKCCGAPSPENAGGMARELAAQDSESPTNVNG